MRQTTIWARLPGNLGSPADEDDRAGNGYSRNLSLCARRPDGERDPEQTRHYRYRLPLDVGPQQRAALSDSAGLSLMIAGL